MPVFLPSRWMPFHFSYLSSYKSSCDCRYCAAVAILPTCCSAYWRSWTEVKKKCSISRCILLSPKYSRSMAVGTKTLAAEGCLKHFIPEHLRRAWAVWPCRVWDLQLWFCRGAEASDRRPECKIWRAFVFQSREMREFCASTMSTLHGHTCWITASTALLQPTGLFYDWDFLRSSRQWNRQKCSPEKPSFSLCRTVSAISSSLSPPFCSTCLTQSF